MMFIDAIKSVFENKNIKKISHGIKDDIVFLSNSYDISFEGELFDTEIGAYILEPSKNSYNIEELAEEYIDTKVSPQGWSWPR